MGYPLCVTFLGKKVVGSCIVIVVQRNRLSDSLSVILGVSNQELDDILESAAIVTCWK